MTLRGGLTAAPLLASSAQAAGAASADRPLGMGSVSSPSSSSSSSDGGGEGGLPRVRSSFGAGGGAFRFSGSQGRHGASASGDRSLVSASADTGTGGGSAPLSLRCASSAGSGTGAGSAPPRGATSAFGPPRFLRFPHSGDVPSASNAGLPRRFVEAGGVPAVSGALRTAGIHFTLPDAAAPTARYEDRVRREAGLWMPKEDALEAVRARLPRAAASAFSAPALSRAIERLVFGGGGAPGGQALDFRIRTGRGGVGRVTRVYAFPLATAAAVAAWGGSGKGQEEESEDEEAVARSAARV